MSDGAGIRSSFRSFLAEPSGERFVSLRNHIIQSPEYDPYRDSFAEIRRLIEDGAFDAARHMLEQQGPTLVLSPRAHLINALLAEAQANEDLCEHERDIALTCVEAIAATGDGSRDRPYHVLRPSDEYDVLEFLGEEGRTQRLVHDGERHFDVQVCGEKEVWFDISDAYNWLQARLSQDED